MQRESVVCFVNHTAEMGGAEFGLIRLIAAMNQERWHPVAVFGENGPAVELLRSRSIETYVLPLRPDIGKIRKETLCWSAGVRPGQVAAAAAYVLKLARFFKERGVDIVHTNSLKAHALGGLAAKVARIPLLWRLRDSLHPACLPQPALKLMRFMAHHLPERVVSASLSVAANAFGETQTGRSPVLYDGLDAASFDHPAQISPAEHRNPWRIGISGRLCPWKGQHVFLEAAAKLLERGHKIQFEILGGPLFGQEAYAARLKHLAETCALRDNVLYAGHVSDVSRRIRNWDVLVHASTLPDPCPNVVMEAMAAGVPVVGADAGGVPELLDRGRCGMLFEADNPNALCSAIETLLNAPQRRRAFARAARVRALEHYQSGKMARQMETIWSSLLHPKVRQRRRWPWLESNLSPRAFKRVARSPKFPLAPQNPLRPRTARHIP